MRDLKDDRGSYCGSRVAGIAATYQRVRVMGRETFAYSSRNPFSASSIHRVRDSGGKALIDCSSFAGLCLRGIPYEKSPFARHKGADAAWDPSTELPSMYGTEGWEFRVLDRQKAGRYNDIGIQGCSTLRFAADLAEYFFKQGCVIFDARADGVATERLTDRLLPGDLLFWAKSSASEIQKKRFCGISHVGIVAERTDRFFETTSGEKVVLCSSYANKCSEIVLICRPDYRTGQAESGDITAAGDRAGAE